jgi:hypothetical protein
VFIGSSDLASVRNDLDSLKTKLADHEERLESHSERMDTLEEKVTLDRQQTIMILADHCERHDHNSNVAKLKCVLLTGMVYSLSKCYTMSFK